MNTLNMMEPNKNLTRGLCMVVNICSRAPAILLKYTDTRPQNTPSSTTKGMRMV